MKILLAPMEGVVDSVVRELWTAIGGIDYCVTEFIRVTSTLYPDKVFYRDCPELLTGSRTLSGTPVFLQLLGSDLITMGENAHKAASLGAFGIDINFGCPAKTVNRHDGGAALLRDPERVFQVTQAVRRSVPQNIPVTAKVRLGFADSSQCVEIAQAAQAGGAHWLTVHARTKMDGYKPPAHWEKLALIRENIQIPLIANGEIWSPEDYSRCLSVSQCQDAMIGRGLMARPDLALEIKTGSQGKTFAELAPLLHSFIQKSEQSRGSAYAVSRTKQLCKLWARTYPEADTLFQIIKTSRCLEEIKDRIDQFFLSMAILPSVSRTLSPQLLANH